MSDKLNMAIIRETASQCRELTAEQPGLAQIGLLTDDRFAKYLTDRLRGIYWGHSVFRIWRSGLLRADYLDTDEGTVLPGIDQGLKKSGRTCVDNRPVPLRNIGWGGSLSVDEKSLSLAIRQWWRRIVLRVMRILNLTKMLRRTSRPNPTFSSIKAAGYFHSFRTYPVFIALKLTAAQSSSLQFLLNDEGLLTIATLYKTQLRRSTAAITFTESIEFANCLSEICIALEPIAYQSIFGSVRWRHPETRESIQDRIAERLDAVGPILDRLGLDQIDEIRRVLCREAEMVDGNKRLHVLMRLARSSERQKLKGDIGLCMTFLTMAEVLRRAAEKHFSVSLQEEDELGFGQWMPGARKLLYGTDRLLDADQVNLVTFLQQMGLNHGTKIRCYVEGRTEGAALNYVFEPYGQISVVDLAGQVVEKRRKGLAFRESLRRDIDEQVFSFVFFDGDVTYNHLAVKQAAKKDEIVGGFFVSEPDFEMENFTHAELLDVAVEIAEIDLSTHERQQLLTNLSSCSSASQFFSILRNFDDRFSQQSKGEIWGEMLMKLALSTPRDDVDEERSIVKAVRLVLMGLNVSYVMHRSENRVDVESGLPIKID